MAHPGPVAILYLHDVKLQQKRLWSRISQLEEYDYTRCIARVDDLEQQLLNEMAIHKIIDDRLSPLIREHVTLKNENKTLTARLSQCNDEIVTLTNALDVNICEQHSLSEKLEKAQEIGSDCESALDNLARRVNDLELSRKDDQEALQNVKENLGFDLQEHATSIREHKSHLGQLDIQIRSFHKLMKEQRDTLQEKIKRSSRPKSSRSSNKADLEASAPAIQTKPNDSVTVIPDSQPATLLTSMPPNPEPTPSASISHPLNTVAADVPTAMGLNTPLPTEERLLAPPRLTAQSTTLTQDQSNEGNSQQETVPTQLLENRYVSQSCTNLLIATQPYLPRFSLGGKAGWETPSTQDVCSIPLPPEDTTSFSSAGIADSVSTQSLSKNKACKQHVRPCEASSFASFSSLHSGGFQAVPGLDNETQVAESQPQKVTRPTSSRTKARNTSQPVPAPERMRTRQSTRSQQETSKKRNLDRSQTPLSKQCKQARR